MKTIKKIDEDYLRLIRQVPLLPIENEQAYRDARKLLSQLIDRDEELSATENWLCARTKETDSRLFKHQM